jgi:hypothetical protein
VKAAQKELKDHPDAARDKALQTVADRLITPPIRYSQPALQTHVSYLYSETNSTDQKVGRDAIERYEVLRREVDAVIAELNAVLGPPTQADLARYYGGDDAGEPARDNNDDES